MQACLAQIEELARFSGPPEAATLKADSILEKITELQNQIELERLETSRNIHRERDQVKLLVVRLRNAELSARELRREKWFKQRQQFALAKPPQGKQVAQPQSSEAMDDDLDSPAVGVAEQVSGNLRRIHQLAQAEVLRSELNIEELQTSTNALTSVQNQYSGVDMLLNGSKRLVRLLDEADAKDRRNMQLALSFLGAVLIWIVYRRILKLPIKLFMWSLARFLGILRFFSTSAGGNSGGEAHPPSLTGFIEASMDTATSTLLEAVLSATETHTIASFITETILGQDPESAIQIEPTVPSDTALHPDL